MTDDFNSISCFLNKIKKYEIYDSLYAYYKFFYQVPDFDYKILVTRRSYDLFKIFKIIFQQEEIQHHGLFYSSNFITQLELDNKSVLVFDDIIINGRSVGNIFDFLSNKRNGKNIKLWSFLRNNKAKCLSKIKNNFLDEFTVDVNESYWRGVSNQLNEIVGYSMLGYISYVDSIRLNLHYSKEFFEIYNNETIRQENILFNKLNITSNFVFLKYNSFKRVKGGFAYRFLKLLDSIGALCLIRIYQNGSNENFGCTAIPFVYLPTVKKEKFKDYFIYVLNHFDLDNSNFDQESLDSVINKTQIDDEYIFLYKWLTFFLSKGAEKVLLESIGSLDSCTNVLFDCKESFGSLYFSKFSFSFSSAFHSISNSYFILDDDYIESTAEQICYKSFSELFKMINNSDNIMNQKVLSSIFSRYLYKMRGIDNERAKLEQDRLKGLRVDDVLLNNNNLSSEDIVSCIINEWDCGNGSGNPKIFKNKEKECISNSTINGEQIYKYIFDLHPQITYDFKVFYLNSFCSDIKGLVSFAKYMDEKFSTKEYENFILEIINNGGISDFLNGIIVNNLIGYDSLSNHFNIIVDYLR